MLRVLLRAGWLALMWMIAALAGGNVVYSLENDLLGLGIVGLLLALIALGGSLLVLSSNFESNFRFESPPPAPRPVAAPRPVPLGMVVHEAAAPTGDKQICARCGIVLVDFNTPGSWGRAWPAGTWISVTDGSVQQVDLSNGPGTAHRPCTSIGAW